MAYYFFFPDDFQLRSPFIRKPFHTKRAIYIIVARVETVFLAGRDVDSIAWRRYSFRRGCIALCWQAPNNTALRRLTQ